MTSAAGDAERPTSPPPQPTPPRPAATGAPVSARTPNAPATRNWLLRWRRTTQPTPPDYFEGAEGRSERVSLLHRNPFYIGFFIAAGGITAYALLTSLGQLRDILVLVVLCFALALGLNPVVEWFHNRGIRRGLAVFIVALALLALLALAGWAIVPVVNEQVQSLYANAPRYLVNLRDNPQIAAFDQQFQVIDKIVAYLTTGELISSLFGGLVGAGQAVANVVFSITISVVLTLYFLTSLPAIKEVIYQLAPASRRARTRYLATEAFKRVGGFVSGIFLVAMLWAAMSFVLLNLIGLSRFAVALAVVVGLLAFIPLVGTSIAIIIVAIVAFSFGQTTGIIAVLVMLAYQQFDAYFIQPRIFARSVQVPGVLVILAAVSGGLLLGLVGAILAIPTMAALLLLYREVLIPHLDRN
ncbi:MAG: AI-2E family transporter [Propionicimonas sp.]